MGKFGDFWGACVNRFFQYLPSCVVCLNFLPSGLVFGYTIASFVAERNNNSGLIAYAPMILGACCSLLAALSMFIIKLFKKCIPYWHVYILMGSALLNVLGSCFYFAEGFDDVGAFISYVAHSLTFVVGLSFLHSIPGKKTRAVLMAVGFSFYLMGLAAAMSLIDNNLIGTEGYYVNFAAVYLAVSVLVLCILIGLKILNIFGHADFQSPMDNTFRIANSNGTIFDKRDELIKRIEFFYVTRSQQWNVTLLLIFTEAVQYALFVYYVFWFSMNQAMRLTEIKDIDIMMWVIFAGSVLAVIVLASISVKINFAMNQCILIFLTILSMILYATIQTRIPLWLVLFFFGMNFCNLQVAIVEVSHFRFTEILICVSYILKLLSTSIVYFYFVSESKNSYFYAIDDSTLMAQGFIYIIIAALQGLVVGMKVPRTHRKTLFEIQYGLLGIIFTKHQIELLNVKWINDGTIPTVEEEE